MWCSWKPRSIARQSSTCKMYMLACLSRRQTLQLLVSWWRSNSLSPFVEVLSIGHQVQLSMLTRLFLSRYRLCQRKSRSLDSSLWPQLAKSSPQVRRSKARDTKGTRMHKEPKRKTNRISEVLSSRRWFGSNFLAPETCIHLEQRS